jgi:DNA-directed RNA polymerase specialized sigma24 family protein
MTYTAPRSLAAARRVRTTAEGAAWQALAGHARSAAASVLRLPVRHADVEDLAQDALVAFLSSGARRYDPAKAPPRALLAVIARNLALSQLRARANRARLLDRNGPPAPGSDVGQRRVEAAGDLERILSRLHPSHVEALLRIDLRGDRIEDEARRTGKSYAAVNGQVGHARAAARRAARELVAA